MFGLLRDVHWWSSVERQLAGFESLPLILHRFSELSIHNGHSGVHESERVSRPCTRCDADYPHEQKLQLQQMSPRKPSTPSRAMIGLLMGFSEVSVLGG
jgi:hypothetical protein